MASDMSPEEGAAFETDLETYRQAVMEPARLNHTERAIARAMWAAGRQYGYEKAHQEAAELEAAEVE